MSPKSKGTQTKPFNPADNLTMAGRGRRPGSKNRFGQEAKEAFALAFDGIGGVPELIKWARINKETFYKLYSKLIPVELNGTGSKGAIIISITDGESKL